jgi:hypothetical protein
MLEILEQEGRATNMSKATATYPRGNDTATPTPSAAGGVSSELGDDPEQTGIFLDANLFDEKVRRMVEQAGGQYNFKAAVGAGLIKRFDPELLAAMGRLEKAAPLLNRAVAMARARQRAKGSASGSESGSASGCRSGSVSGETGSESGSMSGDLSKALRGDQEAGLRFMGRR